MIVSGMQMEKDRVGDGFFWNKNLVKGYLQVFWHFGLGLIPV